MGAKSEQTKGRLKKAAGEITHNDRLKREGQLDETAGKAKELCEKARKAEEEITKEDGEEEEI